MKKEEKIRGEIKKTKNLRLISFSVLVIVFSLIGAFKFPIDLNKNEESEIVIEDWMLDNYYFGENEEAEYIIENWMLDDNYFNN